MAELKKRMKDPKRHLTHLITFTLAALLVAPVMASADDHPWHPPRYRVIHKRKVVVVHQDRPVRRRKLVVVNPPQQEHPNDMLGIGLRVSGTGLDGQKIGLSDFENPGMVGFGVQLRSKVSEHWGLELSADYLTSTEEDSGFGQTSIPVMLSGMFFLFPDTPINPYALAGAGVNFTKLSYMDGMFEHHILEVAGQLGAGVQVKLGRRFAIHADLRFLTVYKNLGSTTEVSNACLQSKAGTTGYCNGLKNLDPEDKFNIGAQFQAGATYYF